MLPEKNYTYYCEIYIWMIIWNSILFRYNRIGNVFQLQYNILNTQNYVSDNYRH